MALFWIVAAVVTAAVVVPLLRPLLRGGGRIADRASHDLEIYRDQLAEVERDLARGVIEPSQADAARTEIGRRILASAAPAPAADVAIMAATPPGRGRRRLAWALLIALPVAALSTYVGIGRPDLPAQPLSDRLAATAKDQPPPEVIAAVTHLAERLKQEPNNLEGWVLLAQSQGKMGRLDDAVESWRRASALVPDDGEIRGNLAEALTAANQGLVPDEAAKLFEAMQAKTPADPRAGHYLALARAQAGDFQGALDRWRALAAATPADAPWLPLVRQRIADMAERLKLDPAQVTPPPLPPRGPAPADAKGAQADERVRAMVDKLAAKLKAEPGDIAGWLRLARAYEVMGDADKQADALKQARERAPRNAEVLVASAAAILARNPPGETDRLPAEAAKLLADALEVAPDTQAALWYLGIDAANAGKRDEARALWTRLLSALSPGSPDYAEVKARLDRLK